MGRGGECGEMSKNRTVNRRVIGVDLLPDIGCRCLRNAPPRPKG